MVPFERAVLLDQLSDVFRAVVYVFGQQELLDFVLEAFQITDEFQTKEYCRPFLLLYRLSICFHLFN